MSEENNAMQSNDAVLPESNEGGEPQGSTGIGESENQSSANREPGAEGLFDGMDAQTLHKSYKSLQGQFTKVNEQFKDLEKYGGPSQLKQWADYLSDNPRFTEWVQGEQAKNALGVDPADMSPEQTRALDLVRKMASAEAKTQIDRIVKEQVGPLSEAYKQQLLESHFKVMDDKYGKEWMEFKDTISKLSEDLPDSRKDRPTLEDLEDLYFKALRQTGKFDAYAAKQHEKMIRSKQTRSTGKPAASPGTATAGAKTIAEAFAEAKRAMGQ